MTFPRITFNAKIVPSILIGLAFSALIALGVWQMQRGERKTALIAERTAKLSEKPIILNGLPDGPVSKLYYRGAYVTAPIKIARPYYTFSHTPDHGVGFQIYFPQTWNNDRWFIRKSDFVTMEEWRSGAVRWTSNDVLATMPPREQLGIFVPLDDAENFILLKEFGTESVKDLKDIEPLLFIPLYEWGSVQHELLKARLLNITNKHGMYAFVWFSLAFALFMFYLSAHTKITFKAG